MAFLPLSKGFQTKFKCFYDLTRWRFTPNSSLVFVLFSFFVYNKKIEWSHFDDGVMRDHSCCCSNQQMIEKERTLKKKRRRKLLYTKKATQKYTCSKIHTKGQFSKAPNSNQPNPQLNLFSTTMH